ncbi:MAG TPA: hypothetical protein VFQ07_13655 [Candidatus Polarisedimenticolia bacterium]|nr:hypothetical protein [Candidatus Polarisedimenticolia bacterium]
MRRRCITPTGLAGLLLLAMGVFPAAADAPAPPGPVTTDSFMDLVTITWAPVAGADDYDVVFGAIGPLRATGGDFSIAMRGCFATRGVVTNALSGTPPPVGEAYWVLVRGNNDAGAGTYDSGDPGQVGSRDAGIEAAPLLCNHSACASDADCQPASTCNPGWCITTWDTPYTPAGCSAGCNICLEGCACQNGECIAVFAP